MPWPARSCAGTKPWWRREVVRRLEANASHPSLVINSTMVTKKRGLGRGLDALLGSPVNALDAVSEEEAGESTLRELPLDLVQRGRYQPRTDMDPEALEDLAASIRAQGVVQPIVVRPLAVVVTSSRRTSRPLTS